MKNITRIIKSVVLKFFKDSCLIRASGMAYSTLLAIVPFITIIYAIGGFDTLGKTIESVILKAIIPTQHQEISEALNAFTRNSLATGTLGMILFMLTSIFLINTIARNFDAIWGVFSNVNFFRRYATYTAILVFGSLLLGLSNSLSGSIEDYILSVGIVEVITLRELFKLVVPFLITLLIFFGMLTIIPSTNIKFKSAGIGALVSAVLFEIVKVIFKFWVLNSVKISLIYGSVAIIPVFLIGLYLFWLIVLIGVEISYFIQNQNSSLSETHGLLNIEDKICLGIELFIQITKSYSENKIGGITEKELGKKMNLSPEIIHSLIILFLKDGLILSINSKQGGYIPGRSPDNINLKNIVTSIYGGDSLIQNVSQISLNNSSAFSKGGFEAMDQNSINDILKKDEAK